MCARTSSSVVSPLSAMACDDGALADAVAAADLGVVGHAATAAAGPTGRPPEWAWPKIRVSRMRRDVGAVSHMIEIPGAVGGVAIQHRADDAVVAQHEALVDAAAGVAAARCPRCPSPPEKSPAENRSMPVTFSLVEVTEPL